jgi:hypothetical protein
MTTFTRHRSLDFRKPATAQRDRPMLEPDTVAEIAKMLLDLADDEDALAAIERAQRDAFIALDRAFPRKGPGLFALVCTLGLRDLLANPSAAAPIYAKLLETHLTATPYALVERSAPDASH